MTVYATKETRDARMWDYLVEKEEGWFGRWVTGPFSYGLYQIFDSTGEAIMPILNKPICGPTIKSDADWASNALTIAGSLTTGIIATGFVANAIASPSIPAAVKAVAGSSTQGFMPPLFSHLEIEGPYFTIEAEMMRRELLERHEREHEVSRSSTTEHEADHELERND